MYARRGMLIVVLVMLLGACGLPEASLTNSRALVVNGALTTVSPNRVTGTVNISGSSTVYLLTAYMAREFGIAGSSTKINIAVTGTGGGFRAFCGGEAVDLVGASRPINADEQAACATNGREAVGFTVGTDALSVVVSEKNTFVNELTFDQLTAIFTGKVSRWAELDPSFPNEPIAVFSPGSDSGTFDFFSSTVLGGEGDTLLALPGVVLSEDDEVLASGIESNPYAIGYFGYGYYRDARGRLRAVAIAKNQGPVAPNAQTVFDESYPLTRPLFIYTSRDILTSRPEVAAFVGFYLQHTNEWVEKAGYFPTTPPVMEESLKTLVTALS